LTDFTLARDRADTPISLPSLKPDSLFLDIQNWFFRFGMDLT
jgi:hypothetical protein